MRWLPLQSKEMNCTVRTEIHPVEILIVAALVVAEALITVLTALITLVATALDREPVSFPSQLPEPFTHPLFTVAHDLQAMTCEELRGLAGTRRKFPKHALIGMVAAGV
jgi:hypothetical protein